MCVCASMNARKHAWCVCAPEAWNVLNKRAYERPREHMCIQPSLHNFFNHVSVCLYRHLHESGVSRVHMNKGWFRILHMHTWTFLALACVRSFFPYLRVGKVSASSHSKDHTSSAHVLPFFWSICRIHDTRPQRCCSTNLAGFMQTLKWLYINWMDPHALKIPCFS